MKQICFVDGTIGSASEPCLPADDLGLQRGYAVFDYARTHNEKLFHIHEHLARFRQSAAGLRLELAYSDEQIIDIASELFAKLGVENPGLRLILTGGSAHAPKLLENPRFIMIAEELPAYPARVYENGVKLVTFEFQRDLPRVKTTDYMNAFRLEPFKLQSDAFDILYLWQGIVLECPRDNFFIWRGDTLVTAKDDVLHGITRNVVIDLMRDHGIVEERGIAVGELDLADEAFLTSTTKSIVPVVQIDERQLCHGAVGERTRALMERFHEYTEKY